jgi:type VI protein secretion system component VasF
MSRRRTRAEHDQDRKLAFVPMWPLVAAFVLLAVVVYLTTR